LAVTFDRRLDLVHLPLAQRGQAQHEAQLLVLRLREPELCLEILGEL
jgi:hypothetical protein